MPSACSWPRAILSWSRRWSKQQNTPQDREGTQSRGQHSGPTGSYSGAPGCIPASHLGRGPLLQVGSTTPALLHPARSIHERKCTAPRPRAAAASPGPPRRARNRERLSRPCGSNLRRVGVSEGERLGRRGGSQLPGPRGAFCGPSPPPSSVPPCAAPPCACGTPSQTPYEPHPRQQGRRKTLKPSTLNSEP